MYQCKTPVVLLIFKRAEQTAQVFEVVRQVKPPQLLVVADGPREDRPEEVEKCAATRAVIEGVDWDCEVLTNYSDVNLGCKERVSSGLTWVFSLVEEAIIIEDDCVPDVSFFRYCDELLEKYRNCPQVMSVTGENTHGYQNPDASYCFSYYSFYWGWATWRRAWELFDGKMELWGGLRKTNWLSNLLQDEDATAYWAKIFDQTFDGFNSWGWAWTFACFVNQGLCAVANNNLITNIGFGPDAAHHTWSVDELGGIPIEPIDFPLVHPSVIMRDLKADLAIDNVRFSGRQKFRSLRNQGLKQLDKENYAKSIEFFDQCLQLRPDLIGLNYAKAVCQARMNNTVGAIATLSELLAYAPSHEKARLLLGELQSNSTNNDSVLHRNIELEDLMASLPLKTIYEPVAKPEKPQPVVIPANQRSGETTIFAIPKAFHGHIGVIQRNAITSWTKLNPRPEIILFGEDEGTAEIAQELGIIHVPKIKCNEFGTPMLDDIFVQAQQLSTKDVVTYVNADIMLLQDFVEAVKGVAQQYEEFMMIGRRWDIDITEVWDFNAPNWVEDLTQLITYRGMLHNVTGKDYFCFPKNLFAEIPAFAVGRAKWDNWMIHEALTRKYHVIDATQGVMAIHQNHDYGHLKGGKLESSRGKEAMQNKLAGGTDFAGTIADATKQYIPPTPPNTPRVSVVITTCDRDQTIKTAIDSILSQTYENYEIIVVDYGSTDNTGEIIKTYGDRVKYLRQEQQNLLEALNRGIKEAKGELIAFLDGYSSFLPNKLREQLQRFDRRGSLEFVSSGWQILDESGAIAEEVEPWKQLGTLEPEEMHIWKHWKLWHKFPLSAVMFRKTQLQAISGFNTQLHPEVATVDLILRLASRGCLGSWLRQPTCCYPQPDNLDSINPDNLETIASSFELLLNNFFNSELTPDWMQILKSQAYYNTWVFMAWLMHQHSHFQQRDRYLQKSLANTSYSSKDATQDWSDKFTKFAQEFGVKFDPQTLKNLVT
jgi:glycosyltransferase involved in cell wall biosynthesis/tetratricopeptide (TPR) repeat protein